MSSGEICSLTAQLHTRLEKVERELCQLRTHDSVKWICEQLAQESHITRARLSDCSLMPQFELPAVAAQRLF